MDKIVKRNAKIKYVSIDTEERYLQIVVGFDYGGLGQALSRVAYLPESYKYHRKDTRLAHFLNILFKVTGVNSFDKLKGSPLRVRATNSKVVEIGHFLEDDWYNIDEIWGTED